MFLPDRPTGGSLMMDGSSYLPVMLQTDIDRPVDGFNG